MSEVPVTIDRRFVVNLKGREFPTYAGSLDAATKSGLKSLTTRIIQVPSTDNGHYAVVEARAEFEDGRVFTDVADCSPASTSAQLAAAALRLASTRAKGRVLRDSINVGMTLLEEMPDAHEAQQQTGNGNGRQQPAPEPPPVVCATPGCGSVLTRDEINAAIKYSEAYGGNKYCTEDGRPLVKAWKDRQRAAEDATATGDPFEDQ